MNTAQEVKVLLLTDYFELCFHRENYLDFNYKPFRVFHPYNLHFPQILSTVFLLKEVKGASTLPISFAYSNYYS